MKQYLLDISVILDLLLNRSPWAADAAAIWDAHRNGRLRALVAAFSLPTIYYLVRRHAGAVVARAAVQDCLSTLAIAPIDRATLSMAQALAGPDFDSRPRQRIIEVTEAITIGGDNFEFVQDFRGLEVLAPKGTLIGRDNGREVRTPYDDCVLIMPSRRLAKGQTAVRLGRYIA